MEQWSTKVSYAFSESNFRDLDSDGSGSVLVVVCRGGGVANVRKEGCSP